jgi:hypothetical protein
MLRVGCSCLFRVSSTQTLLEIIFPLVYAPRISLPKYQGEVLEASTNFVSVCEPTACFVQLRCTETKDLVRVWIL